MHLSDVVFGRAKESDVSDGLGVVAVVAMLCITRNAAQMEKKKLRN